MPRSTNSTPDASRRSPTTPRTKTVKSKGRSRSTAAPQRARPSEDEIRRRAFELYEERSGNGSGSESDSRQPIDDWLEAEAQLAPKSRQR